MAPIQDDRSEISVPTSAHALQKQKLKEETLKVFGKWFLVGLLSFGAGTVVGFGISLIQDMIQDMIKNWKAKEKGEPKVSSDDEITDDMLEEDALGDIVAGMGRKRKRGVSYEEVEATQEMLKVLEDPEFLELLIN
jgi:hypothetical protein